MVLAQNENQPILIDLRRREPRRQIGKLRAAKETDLKTARRQRFDLVRARHFAHRQAYIGVALAKREDRLRHRPGKRRRSGHPDRHLADFPAMGAPCDLDRMGRLVERGARLGQKKFPDFREFDAAVCTLEETGADLFLKYLDLLAERGLGDAEPSGGAAEMKFLGDVDEIAQVP